MLLHGSFIIAAGQIPALRSFFFLFHYADLRHAVDCL